MPRVVVASFNVHGGVDGWGRPFDVVDACSSIGADVLMLQECWNPDGGVTMAQRVATHLGYVSVVELAFARGRIFAPPDRPSKRWGPRLLTRSVYGLRLDRHHSRSVDQRVLSRPTLSKAERGTWAIAVVSKMPVTGSQTIDLGKLPTDHARRGAIVVDFDQQGASIPLRVVATHLAHLSQGSPRHIASLRRTLNDLSPVPCVLAGDMNLWGPPLVLLLPGWKRAVRGRSWPTWSSWPVAQPDHILVKGPVTVENGEVLPVPGSDHYPVRATLVID